MTNKKYLTALPVYNEVGFVDTVLDKVKNYSQEVLVVNDGSTDGTAELLATRQDIHLVSHETNRGYGAALTTAFDFAIKNGFDVLVTIDCDGQHQPCRIPLFVETCLEQQADIVSGSRYLKKFEGDSLPPEQRRAINQLLTAELNERLGLDLTDAFCGFKAYRVGALEKLRSTDPGYAMPLEVWVLAALSGLKIVELPVPLIYLEEERSFGGALDDGETRMAYYRRVLDDATARAEKKKPLRPICCGGKISC